MNYTAETIIYRSCSVVFDHLTDPEKIKNWRARLSSTTSQVDLHAGGAYYQTILLPRRPRILKGRVLALEANRELAFELESVFTRVKRHYSISREGPAGVRLVAHEEVTPLSFISKLLISLFKKLAQDRLEQDLRMLKVYLDEGDKNFRKMPGKRFESLHGSKLD